MNDKNEMVRMYETMLTLPSMDESLKFSQGIKRKHILLLSLIIETGLQSGNDQIKNLLAAMPKETSEELMRLSADYMEKAGLTELGQKLKSFNQIGNGK